MLQPIRPERCGARGLCYLSGMTETEQKRMNEARDTAKKAPLDAHVPFRWRDNDPPHVQSCIKCGLMMPRSGFPNPCKGAARIELR